MIGQSIAHYSITAKLGEGGMGVVYRARDTKLNRDVAIKLLPDSLVSDASRSDRFRREAQLLAQLNHPGIAGIYGVEEANASLALVMELAEGQTLEERLAAGPLPLDDALPIARQIAEALEAAHEKGIIHRDLKPANIKVTADNAVKILDFGLAKALEGDPTSSVEATQSPTLTVAATQAGIILGTAAYMSPEQARGRTADKRADIWSFGVVLYEMLTGQRLFSRETMSDSLAAVLMADIDFSTLPTGTPASIQRLLRRCLERVPKNRLQAIGEARIAINEQIADPTGTSMLMEAPAIVPESKRRVIWPVAAGVVAVALLVSLAALWRATRPAAEPLMQFSVDLGVEISPGSGMGAAVVVSPDGTRIVFAGVGADGKANLYTRLIGEQSETVVGDTVGAHSPFFSPDGQWLAFFAEGKLKKTSFQGGAVMTICDAPTPRGGSWGDDDYIIAALGSRGALSRIPASGGTPEAITDLDQQNGEDTHRWPQVLPGGRAFLFTAGTGGITSWDNNIIVSSPETGQRKILHRGGTYGRYLPSGHLVFISNNVLFGAPMDLNRLELLAPPVPILNGLATTSGGGGQFDASQTGMLAYFPRARVAGRDSSNG